MDFLFRNNVRDLPAEYQRGGVQSNLFGGQNLDHTPAMQEAQRRLQALGLTGRTSIRKQELDAYDVQFKRSSHFEVTRRLREFVIPYLSEEALYQYHPWNGSITMPENIWLLPFISSKVGFFSVSSPYGEYLWAELDKSSYLTRSQPAFDRIRSVQLEIPSLVKNAVVVMRTIAPVDKKRYTVLIRGSRATHSGGQWTQEVALFALERAEEVRIDLYDPHEEPGEEVITHGERKAKIRRIRGMYPGSGKEYDVVVDDSWTANAQGGWRSESVYFSEKDLSGKTEPFLHPKEGRIFSHEPRERTQVRCPCRLCQTVATFTNAENFQRTRKLLITLGAVKCDMDTWSDQLKERDLLMSLRMGSVSQTSRNERAIMLARYHGKTKVEGQKAYQGEPKKMPLTRFFEGKRVYFVGVPPAILGEEKYDRVAHRSTYANDPGSVTVTDHASGASSTGSNEVWSLVDIPGFRRTGRVFQDLAEQVRIDRGGAKLQVAHFSHKYGRPLPPEVARPLKGVFRIPADSSERVCGPGGTDPRKITIVNEEHAFPGGGFRLKKGVYGSYPPDYGVPVACGSCRTGKCVRGHLYYEKSRIKPPEWSFLLPLLDN